MTAPDAEYRRPAGGAVFDGCIEFTGRHSGNQNDFAAKEPVNTDAGCVDGVPRRSRRMISAVSVGHNLVEMHGICPVAVVFRTLLQYAMYMQICIPPPQFANWGAPL